MERTYVGEVKDLDADRRIVVVVDGERVVVFRHRERYTAVQATCIHSGGPLEDGMITPKIETVVDDQGRAVCDRLSEEEFHLVCPWHGWEYDIATGEFAGDRSRRLRTYKVEEEGSSVYVSSSPER